MRLMPRMLLKRCPAAQDTLVSSATGAVFHGVLFTGNGNSATCQIYDNSASAPNTLIHEVAVTATKPSIPSWPPAGVNCGTGILVTNSGVGGVAYVGYSFVS